ncbi:hypothetical protein Rcae01_04347 [Novipirellula caenicola]|uniref:T6SS immunity protein Tdi1 C-terminal domain-containing protein n=2 Tax=Novipirellula caenicola TaxID=1536901 RepID=A0ABP9VXD0_9BACT
MANLIIETSPTINWYSDLFPFFSMVESTIRSRRWLWTDVEINRKLPVPDNVYGRYLIDGDTLYDFAVGRPQFVWSVLSALPADADFDPTMLDSVPSADGNPDFWHGAPKPQFPGAEFEIVCWDSSATLMIGAGASVSEAFRAAYPGALDLDVENQSRG